MCGYFSTNSHKYICSHEESNVLLWKSADAGSNYKNNHDGFSWLEFGGLLELLLTSQKYSLSQSQEKAMQNDRFFSLDIVLSIVSLKIRVRLI